MDRTSTARLAALALAGLSWTGTARASDLGGPRGRVGPLAQVSENTPFGPLEQCGDTPAGGVNFINSEVEPWVEVNPTNQANIAAFWQQDRWSRGGARGNVAGVSLDGGRTWETVVVPGLTQCAGGPFERASDPWLSFSPDGTLHQMSLVLSGEPFSGRSGMAASRSRDGGLTWSEPILLIDDEAPFLNDKNSITADPFDRRFVYAVWNRIELVGDGSVAPVYFARSIDGGARWEPAREIFDLDVPFNNTTSGQQLLVGPGGILYNFFVELIFFDAAGNPIPEPETTLAFVVSFDRGESWFPQGRGRKIVDRQPAGAITPDDGVFVRSPGNLFDVAIDVRRGRLYAVWQDGRFADVGQIAFSQSRNLGVTWSSPIAVNLTPASAGNPLRDQAFIPSVAVAGDGTVGVSYYDFRNDDASAELADHFLALCRRRCDRERSWRREVRLTDDSFDLLQAPASEIFPGFNVIFIGDYVGLAAGRRSFVALFPQAFSSDDPASSFARRVSTRAHRW